MTTFMLILNFGGGLMLLFALGWIMGQITKLNEHFKH